VTVAAPRFSLAQAEWLPFVLRWDGETGAFERSFGASRRGGVTPRQDAHVASPNTGTSVQ